MTMVQIRVDLCPIDQIRRSSLEAKGAIIIVPAPSGNCFAICIIRVIYTSKSRALSGRNDVITAI